VGHRTGSIGDVGHCAGPVLLVLTWWLGNLDSNQDKQSQSLLCYRYTIPQELLNGINSLAGWPGQSLAGGDANHRLAGAPFYSLGQGLGKKVWRAVLGENVGRSTRPR
jgi:hypothetical protein